MTTRKELVETLQVRYGGAAFCERIKILDEFVALTGYHRMLWGLLIGSAANG